MRVAYYAGVSTAAAAVCLLKAFHERPNFYSATVYLSQSSACLLILTNFLLLCACSFVYALQRLFYGPLRPIEIEQLSERAWYAVLDTLLAMPSFREDVGGWLLIMFVLLLTGKVWGWIGEGRVDIFEQQPPLNPRMFHARLASSLLLSVIFDICMLKYCFDVVTKPGMMVIFTFEFAILLVFSTFTLGRYILNIVSNIVQKRQVEKAIELRKQEIKRERVAAQQAAQQAAQEAPEGQSPSGHITSPDEPIEVDENEVDVPGWEDKRRYLFGLEMTADLVKLTLYIVFFTVSVMFNGLPMHIIRDVYMTFTSFTKRLSDYVNWRKATSDMNDRYPDATEAEIRGDSCIVCRDDMHPWIADAVDVTGQAVHRDEGSRPKKLPCGHILHMRCLKAWLERQQVCPTCRRPVVSAAAPAGTNAAAAPAGAIRPAGLNRARFFNFGPLRVGFLNGAAQDVDNVVNQLRGIQPQAQPPAQPQAPQPQPQEQQQAQPGVAPTGARTQFLPSRPPLQHGISQDEIGDLNRRILHEASQLNVHQSQLALLRSMADELVRLRAVSQGNDAAGQRFTSTSAHPPSNYLRGFPAQEMRSGDPALPAGLTLPEGWSLMPLRPAAHAPMAAGLHQPAVSVVQPQPTYPATNSAPLRSSSPSVSVAHAATEPSPAEGSPLFTVTPAATTSVEPIRADTATSSAVPEHESKTSNRRPWTSEGWDFDDAQHGSAKQGETQDKGKGKAVAIEDVSDHEA